mgnify:CR=1 FL=1
MRSNPLKSHQKFRALDIGYRGCGDVNSELIDCFCPRHFRRPIKKWGLDLLLYDTTTFDTSFTCDKVLKAGGKLQFCIQNPKNSRDDLSSPSMTETHFTNN